MLCNQASAWRHLQRTVDFVACQNIKRRSFVSGDTRAATIRYGYIGGKYVKGPDRGAQHNLGVTGECAENTEDRSLDQVRPRLRFSKNQPGSKINSKSKDTQTKPERVTAPLAHDRPPTELPLRDPDTPFPDWQTCAVLTDSPGSTSLQDLIDRIPDYPLITDECPLLVFLVTPSYAADAANNLQAFAEVIAKARSKAATPTDFRTLVAVVDRIPQPSPVRGSSVRTNSSMRTTKPPVNDLGSEGLAFASTRLTSIQRSFPRSAPNNGGVYDRRSPIASSNKSGTVTFELQSSLAGSTLSDEVVEGPEEVTTHRYSVQMPLVKTIFHNGLPTTLVHSQYSLAGSSDKPRLDWTRHLEHDTVSLSIMPTDTRNSMTIAVSLPLVALTTARPVAACMGNIVSLLGPLMSESDDDAKTVLASHELEDSVSNYFKARDMQAETVSVWALVMPRSCFGSNRISDFFMSRTDFFAKGALEKDWERKSPKWVGRSMTETVKALRLGAKFCRVMSGGGGWGKKAGLLSLDPDTDYNTLTSNELPAFIDQFDLNLDDSSPLGEVARVGDYVQFFLAPQSLGQSAQLRTETSPQREDQTLIRKPICYSADFGAIPSTIDVLPAVTDSQSSKSHRASLTFYLNHFGALSESGMAVSIQEHEVTPSGVVQRSTQSKLDVPFGRFSLCDDRSPAKVLDDFLHLRSKGRGNLKQSDDCPTREELETDLAAGSAGAGAFEIGSGEENGIDRYFEAAESPQVSEDSESAKETGKVDSKKQESAMPMKPKHIIVRTSDGTTGIDSDDSNNINDDRVIEPPSTHHGNTGKYISSRLLTEGVQASDEVLHLPSKAKQLQHLDRGRKITRIGASRLSPSGRDYTERTKRQMAQRMHRKMAKRPQCPAVEPHGTEIAKVEVARPEEAGSEEAKIEKSDNKEAATDPGDRKERPLIRGLVTRFRPRYIEYDPPPAIGFTRISDSPAFREVETKEARRERHIERERIRKRRFEDNLARVREDAILRAAETDAKRLAARPSALRRAWLDRERDPWAEADANAGELRAPTLDQQRDPWAEPPESTTKSLASARTSGAVLPDQERVPWTEKTSRVRQPPPAARTPKEPPRSHRDINNKRLYALRPDEDRDPWADNDAKTGRSSANVSDQERDPWAKTNATRPRAPLIDKELDPWAEHDAKATQSRAPSLDQERDSRAKGDGIARQPWVPLPDQERDPWAKNEENTRETRALSSGEERDSSAEVVMTTTGRPRPAAALKPRKGDRDLQLEENVLAILNGWS